MDGIVRFAMEFVGLQLDVGKRFIRDLATNGVPAVIQTAGYFQPFAVVVAAIRRTTVL
jgi:hypothetical protein